MNKKKLGEGVRFLTVLFGRYVGPDALISIWSPGRRVRFFDSIEQAATHARALAKSGKDAYFGCGLYRPGIKSGRGKADDVVLLPVLWADLDCGKKGGFASKKAAREWLDSLALKPQVQVDSGGGIHAYWRLDHPIGFAKASDKTIPARWIDFLSNKLPESVKLDAVGDPARVLRVPGTKNFKRAPAIAVRLLRCERKVIRRERVEELVPKSRGKPTKTDTVKVTIEEVRKIVASLSSALAGNYDTWLRVGMSIHSVHPTAEGLEIWKTFSQRTECGNYDARACEARWAGFSTDGSIGIGTLRHYATLVTAPSDPHHLASELLERFHSVDGHPVLCYFQENWYRWKGTWGPLSKDAIANTITAQCRVILDSLGAVTRVTQTLVRDVVGALRSMVHLEGDKQPVWIGEPDENSEVLCFANGFIPTPEAKSGNLRLRKPTPRLFALNSLPVNFKPKDRAHRWGGFLERVLPNVAARNLLQEFIGYCLTPDTSFQKFLVLHGDGANGKSVICKVIRACLGNQNVSTVGIAQLSGRFSTANTQHMLANIVNEVPRFQRADEETLKALVGGDEVHAERKYRDAVSMKPTAKFIFATNELPAFTDPSEGIWRRVLLLPFDQSVPPEERDPQLAERIIEGERSGVLNWALEGLRRLYDTGFSKVSEATALLERARRLGDPIRQFLRETCVASESGSVLATDLREAYRRWCTANGVEPISKNGLGRRLLQAFPRVRRKQVRRKSERYYVYEGLSLRSDSDDSKST